MPRHHIERRRRQGRFKELARELVDQSVRALDVLVGGDGVLEVARVREPVGAKRTELRELCLVEGVEKGLVGETYTDLVCSSNRT
jgi:hypothetical protein